MAAADSLGSPPDKDDDALRGRVFVGTVVVNDDTGHPDGMRRQRCKLTIPGVLDLTDGYSLVTLPWAIPGSYLADHGAGWGNVDVPSLGAKVQVEFQDGRLEYPIYGAGHIDQNSPAELVINYPNRRGRKLKNGCIHWYDESTDELHLQLPNGFTVHVHTDGSADIIVPGNLVATIHGNVQATVGGNVTADVAGTLTATVQSDVAVSSGTSISLTAPHVHVNG